MDELRAALGPFVPLFALDGPVFAFQDHDALADAEPRPIEQLLIDAPGANTIARNTDLFVKRGRAAALCLPYAAAALVTLQTFAPSGGQGHRTSMRGGGPLTTLVRPLAATTLWHRLWANVPARIAPLPAHPPAVGGDAWARVLPWLGPTRTSLDGAVVGADDGHPLLAFFGCPRRIRLIVEPPGSAGCALGGTHRFGASMPIVRGWRTMNYGANYLGWRHPLSPYRPGTDGIELPLHPGPTSRSYRDWFGIMGGLGSPAAVVRTWNDRLDDAGEAAIDAHGFDMDNMKARGWLSASLPLHAMSDDNYPRFLGLAGQATDAAREAANALSYAVRLARAGEFKRDQSSGEKFQLRDSATDGLAADAGDAFWAETEPVFIHLLERFASDVDDLDFAIRKDWLKVLGAAALNLFDRASGDAGDGGLTTLAIKRLVRARATVASAVGRGGKVAAALRLAETRKIKRKDAR